MTVNMLTTVVRVFVVCSRLMIATMHSFIILLLVIMYRKKQAASFLRDFQRNATLATKKDLAPEQQKRKVTWQQALSRCQMCTI